MAICLKCLIGGSGQGGGLLPPDALTFRASLDWNPNAEEAFGDRHAEFESDGEHRGDPLNGGISATGTLFGNFGLDVDERLERTAYVETYTRDGSIALITLNVYEDDDPSGRAVFSAHLTPQEFDAEAGVEDTTFNAAIFMGSPRFEN